MKKTPFAVDVSDDDLLQLGITAFGYIPTSEIVFAEEVRRICAGNQCGQYGKTWACPPAVGTLEECREKCLRYTSAFVFSSKYDLEDSFDYEGMVLGRRKFKDVCNALYKLLKQPYLLLANEGCSRCESCTYPDHPCRFPDTLFPALEGHGILVNELAKSAGMRYHHGANTVTYFGMVCYNEQ